MAASRICLAVALKMKLSGQTDKWNYVLKLVAPGFIEDADTEKRASQTQTSQTVFTEALKRKSQMAIAEAYGKSQLGKAIAKTAWVLAIDVSGRLTSQTHGYGFICLAPAGMRAIARDLAEEHFGSCIFYFSAEADKEAGDKSWSCFIKMECRAKEIAEKAKRRKLSTPDSSERLLEDAISLDEASALGFVDRKAALQAVWDWMAFKGGGIWGIGRCFDVPEKLVMEHCLKHG